MEIKEAIISKVKIGKDDFLLELVSSDTISNFYYHKSSNPLDVEKNLVATVIGRYVWRMFEVTGTQGLKDIESKRIKIMASGNKVVGIGSTSRNDWFIPSEDPMLKMFRGNTI